MTIENDLRSNKSNLLLVAAVFSAFFCYFFTVLLDILPQVAPEYTNLTILQGLFSLVVAASLIFVSFKISKFDSVKIVIFSLIATIVVTLLILASPSDEIRILLVFISGILFSIGQLGVLTQFWGNNTSQNRGLFGGIAAFFTVFIYFITRAVADQTLGLGYSVTVALVPITLALLIAITYAKTRDKSGKAITSNYYPEKRTIILYSIPWILFCFVNGTLGRNIDLPSSQLLASQIMLVLVIQVIASFVGVFSGGIIADFFGRRPSLALSVTLYGLSTAFSGFSHDTNILFFAFALEGLSWGILLALYGFVVWGDLANKENCAKMYAIGLSIYAASIGLGRLPTILSQMSPATSALIGCSIIFLANLPIALAPELLTSETRKVRKLQGYIRKVKKMSQDQD